MTLAALIAACDADAAGLRALHPLAGATVIEHQLRRLSAAGVGRMFLLLDEWPPALSAPLQRLRAEGIAVDTATSIADAADRLSGDPRILLLADGCLPDHPLIAAMMAAPANSLAVIADGPGKDGYERIDAEMRWAGIATLDGRAMVDTAAMVGDWDPVSTLLRRAVQRDAARIDAGAMEPVMTGRPGGLVVAERGLLARSRAPARGWAARRIEAPLIELLLPYLFTRAASPVWPAIAAALLAVVGGLAALGERPMIGLVLVLPSGIALRVADRLASIQARPLHRARFFRLARRIGMAIGVTGIAFALRRWDGQWGWLLLAALLITMLVAIDRLRRPASAPDGDAPQWLASVSAIPWILLPFGLAGRWDIGLPIASAYTAISLGWLLRRLAPSA